MANGTVIAGKDLLLFVKRSGDANYMLVACQVDLTLTLSQDVTTNTTKCGVSKSFAPMDAKATINAEARVDIDSGDHAMSFNDFAAMQQDETQFSAKICNTSNKIYVEGDAQLAQVELTGDSTTNVKFSANLEFLDPSSLVLEAPGT